MMDQAGANILVYGYGNPGRGDDGLGPALVQQLQTEPLMGVSTECDYQLNVEDALTVSEFDAVIFADATHEAINGVRMRSVRPLFNAAFTTHAVEPQAVLALSELLYGKCPEAYMLEMRGYSWEVGEGLSPSARENLIAALTMLRRTLPAWRRRQTGTILPQMEWANHHESGRVKYGKADSGYRQ